MDEKISKVIGEIRALSARLGRKVKLMEVCGTHTVAIFRHGIRGVIPGNISLLSGPGCPVCVTSVKDVDYAIAISEMSGVVLCTFGDMMRVPGGRHSLQEARAGCATVEIVYSPTDALELAKKDPSIKVVFFGTGFETTSPLIAATISRANAGGVNNFFVYSAHKLVPPALEALINTPDLNVDGFILPGHVSAIIGTRPYEPIASRYGKPSVVTGFGASDILAGILMILRQLERGAARVEIEYSSVVREEGNPKALELLYKYFEPSEAYWRGIGPIPGSGLGIRKEYSRFDAKEKFKLTVPDYPEPKGCSCGEVLRGMKIPTDCGLFGKSCTPLKPIGACMVSAEGSCAAYYKYGGHAAG